MRIHTDVLDEHDIRLATIHRAMTGVRADITPTGSRIRERAFEVHLTGDGPHQAGHASANGAKGASWDEWGIFLAALFGADPSLTVPRRYESAEHFRWATGGRFDTLTPCEQHRRHRWTHAGTAATGSYHVHECECGAISRVLARGHTWQEIEGE